MSLAGWWSVVGLTLSLIGVLLLFRYGMPYQVWTGGSSIYVASSGDSGQEAHERRYDKLGKLGLFLVVLGTICQIVGAVLSSI
jgi:hypothetical protein